MVIFVSPTLTKLRIPGQHGHTEKHLQVLGRDAGDLGAILRSATCFGFDFDSPLPLADAGPAVLPAQLPLASPCAQGCTAGYAAGGNQLQVLSKHISCPYFFNATIKYNFALRAYVPR